MADKLKGKKIAILATDGFEQVELTNPKMVLEEAGATTEIISPKSGEIKGWNFKDWGDKVKVNKTLDQARPSDYDALVLPGGVINPDHLRMEPKAVAFVKEFAQSGKPVAAICHGPWTLVEAGVVKGRKMTSWPSLKTDLKNAARTGSTSRPSSTETSSPAASLTIFRHSARRLSRCLPIISSS
jgi:protease I